MEILTVALTLCILAVVNGDSTLNQGHTILPNKVWETKTGTGQVTRWTSMEYMLPSVFAGASKMPLSWRNSITKLEKRFGMHFSDYVRDGRIQLNDNVLTQYFQTGPMMEFWSIPNSKELDAQGNEKEIYPIVIYKKNDMSNVNLYKLFYLHATRTNRGITSFELKDENDKVLVTMDNFAYQDKTLENFTVTFADEKYSKYYVNRNNDIFLGARQSYYVKSTPDKGSSESIAEILTLRRNLFEKVTSWVGLEKAKFIEHEDGHDRLVLAAIQRAIVILEKED